jgi:4-hydroxybenzoate polyprenyltransferase
VIGLCLAVDFFYSAGPVRLSRRWTLAPIALTVAYVALPYRLGIVVAHGSWGGVDAGLLLGLCVLFFARVILKDIRDRLGDAAHGKPTALLRLGKGATCAVSVVGAVAGTAILVVTVAGQPAVTLVLAAAGAAIVWMLERLRRTDDPALEQVAIGTAARAGNAMLITIVAWLLLLGQHATTSQVSAFVLVLGAVFAASFLSLALHPERVRIAYKA